MEYGAFHLAKAKTKFNPALHEDYVQALMSATKKFAELNTFQNVENDFDDSMESNTGNRCSATKSSLSVTSKMFGESSAEQSENDDHDTDENARDGIDADSETSDDDMDSISMYNSSLQHFTEGFDRICKNNDKMKKRLIDLEKKHQLEVKILKETNTKVIHESVQLNAEMKNQIEALNETHNRKIIELKEENQKLIEQQKLAMEQCKQEYLQLIEDAKRNKYCIGCGNPKQLDIYVCNIECQKRPR